LRTRLRGCVLGAIPSASLRGTCGSRACARGRLVADRSIPSLRVSSRFLVAAAIGPKGRPQRRRREEIASADALAENKDSDVGAPLEAHSKAPHISRTGESE